MRGIPRDAAANVDDDDGVDYKEKLKKTQKSHFFKFIFHPQMKVVAANERENHFPGFRAKSAEGPTSKSH